jgi:hypothetical protein
MSVFQISEKTAEKGVPREGGTQRRVRGLKNRLRGLFDPIRLG